MFFQPQPTKAGTYRVKVYNTDKDHYWKYTPDSDCLIQLTVVDESDKPSNIQFKEAETLMGLCLPMTNTFHQNLMERLNIETRLGCQWQWGRIASEFSQSKNFDFALGAFSPIDKLLEIAMSKSRNDDGTCVEHPNWKILLKTEVRNILWDDNDGRRAVGVVVRDASGNETNIFLKKDSSGKPLVDTKIVLGAGSVGSPAILMRSGMTKHLKDPKNNALHLTDHNLCGKALTFHYLYPSIREKVGSMKLQSYVRLKCGTIALVNIMAVDSSSFLPREFLSSQFFRNEDFPKLNISCILPTKLIDKNTIDLDHKGEPVLTAGREVPFSNDHEDVAELRELTKNTIKTVKEVLHIEIRPTDPVDNNNWDDENFFGPLQLGGVAHELGTIPLKCHDNGKQYHVEDDLRLRTREGVYVCDLSILPFSPEVNPTLTLVASALRLSKTILNPIPPTPLDEDIVYIMNQTGEPIKVFVSNRASITLTEGEIDDNKECKVLGPGDVVERRRRGGVDESVMVYRLDYDTDTVYLPTPVPYIATPGRICAIE